MMKKVFKIITKTAYELIAVISMWFMIAFIYLIAEGEIDEIFEMHDVTDYIFIALMLSGVRFFVYDTITKIKKFLKK